MLPMLCGCTAPHAASVRQGPLTHLNPESSSSAVFSQIMFRASMSISFGERLRREFSVEVCLKRGWRDRGGGGYGQNPRAFELLSC